MHSCILTYSLKALKEVFDLQVWINLSLFSSFFFLLFSSFFFFSLMKAYRQAGIEDFWERQTSKLIQDAQNGKYIMCW